MRLDVEFTENGSGMAIPFWEVRNARRSIKYEVVAARGSDPRMPSVCGRSGQDVEYGAVEPLMTA